MFEALGDLSEKRRKDDESPRLVLMADPSGRAGQIAIRNRSVRGVVWVQELK